MSFRGGAGRRGIGRPILADRRQKLVAHFVLTKLAQQETPTRYEYRVTPKGVEGRSAVPWRLPQENRAEIDA